MDMQLFSPAPLGPLELGNRMVMAPSMGAPQVPASCIEGMRRRFSGSFMLSGGYFDAKRAEANLRAERGDLIAFGRAALANPALPERLRKVEPLNEADPDTFYTAGPEGYTDYPTLMARCTVNRLRLQDPQGDTRCLT